MSLLLALLLQAVPPAATASPPPMHSIHGGPQDITCPIGGEHFEAWQPAMFSTFGERPDGKPYGYLPIPFPLAECPSNKLLIFDDYSASDLATLARLIATADYTRLSETDTTYYRAYWLATRLGRPMPQALTLLLSAIWQVTPDAVWNPPSNQSTTKSKAQLVRYQSEFIAEVGRLGSVKFDGRLGLEARASNAARQMQQFDTAERLRKRALETLAALPEQPGWTTYLTQLKAVIARRDASIEPLDMIPEQQVPFTCLARQPTTPFDRNTCAAPQVAARMTEARNRMTQLREAQTRPKPKPQP